jgi:pimeloyl-ACP methyl ester carboxylesterase
MNFTKFCNNKVSTIAVIGALLACISSNNSHANSNTNSNANNNASTVATTHSDDVSQANTSINAAPFQIGSMHVEIQGNRNAKGAPIILIPGLGSGPYIWEDTIQQLQADHLLFVVTLAGFNGKAPMAGPMIAKAKQSLLELIESKKIDKPILVGHSLGATLSIWFAEEHSNLIRGVYAVEGLPVFPRTENMPIDQRPAMAQGMKAQMLAGTQETFVAQQLQYMQTVGVIDQKLAKTIADRSATSDRTAVAEYMSELIAMDIRKDLPLINVPVAIVSPYYAPDNAAYKISEEAKATYYGSLMGGTPKLQVVSIKDARHFPMLDQPKVFAEKLQSFVQSLN